MVYISFVFAATRQNLAGVFQLEEVQTKLILGKDAVKQFRKSGSTHKQKSHLLDVESISDGIVEAVDN